jgi:hypothetical protein
LRTVYLRYTDKVNKKIVTTQACKYDEHPCFNLIFVCFVFPWKWFESCLSISISSWTLPDMFLLWYN